MHKSCGRGMALLISQASFRWTIQNLRGPFFFPEAPAMYQGDPCFWTRVVRAGLLNPECHKLGGDSLSLMRPVVRKTFKTCMVWVSQDDSCNSS